MPPTFLIFLVLMFYFGVIAITLPLFLLLLAFRKTRRFAKSAIEAVLFTLPGLCVVAITMILYTLSRIFSLFKSLFYNLKDFFAPSRSS